MSIKIKHSNQQTETFFSFKYHTKDFASLFSEQQEANLKTKDLEMLIGRNRHILENQLPNDLGWAALQLVLGHQLILSQVPKHPGYQCWAESS